MGCGKPQTDCPGKQYPADCDGGCDLIHGSAQSRTPVPAAPNLMAITTVVTLRVSDQEHERKVVEIMANHPGMYTLTWMHGTDCARIELVGASDWAINERTIQHLQNS